MNDPKFAAIDADDSLPELSVVIPIFNEAENIKAIATELTTTLDALGRSYELLFVDDGSRDGSTEIIRDLCKSLGPMKFLRLSRNYGQSAALAAGIEHSRGRDIILIDGDLQNDPADIPRLLEVRERGFDLVSGWRKERHDAFWSRRLPSMIANKVIGMITGVRVHDYGCTLKVLRGDIARSLRLYGEMHRFIPALVDDLGGRNSEIPVNHRPRVAGQSKYGLSRTLRVILDLITVKFLSSYATRPIHVFGFAGLLTSAGGFAILAYLSLQKLILGMELARRPLLLLGVLLAVMGIQFITTGLMAELLVRTYHESQGKPVYRVAEAGLAATLLNESSAGNEKDGD